MTQIQLINSVLEWERTLKYQEANQDNHRSESYVNYLAKLQPRRKTRKPAFAWIFRLRTES
jgi:hypothetical protein